MNAAFRSSDTINTLDSYAAFVVLHLSMLECFPKKPSSFSKLYKQLLDKFFKDYKKLSRD